MQEKPSLGEPRLSPQNSDFVQVLVVGRGHLGTRSPLWKTRLARGTILSVTSGLLCFRSLFTRLPIPPPPPATCWSCRQSHSSYSQVSWPRQWSRVCDGWWLTRCGNSLTFKHRVVLNVQHGAVSIGSWANLTIAFSLDCGSCRKSCNPATWSLGGQI